MDSAGEHQPLQEIRTNLPVSGSTTKLPVPHSKLKAPTPVTISFKRPAALAGHNHDAEVPKRLRLDVSSGSNDGSSVDLRREKMTTIQSSLLSRSKSMASVRSKAKTAVQQAAPTQRASVVCSTNALRKAPSVSCIASSKASSLAISAPITKQGKRPAWDLKGRMQDTEDAMNFMKSQNVELMKTTELCNRRLQMLESTNSQLSDEVKTKETLTAAKSSELEKIRAKLREKTDNCEMMLLEMSTLRSKLAMAQSEIVNYKLLNSKFESTISELTSCQITLKSQLTTTQLELEKCVGQNRDLDTKIVLLGNEIDTLNNIVLEKENKIRADECLRRKLHNTIQELKGNIRVFCRVRPPLPNDRSKPMTILFPGDDNRSLEIPKVSSTDEGIKNRSVKQTFTFDRVFGGDADQTAIFEEVSQLVQSALDGYNVCVFAYGQTGSGKTFTMEGPVDLESNQRGMIPRTVEQIFDSVEYLEKQGWKYSMEATFVEIYNEAIRDLLGNDNTLKHEIKMSNIKSNDIYVSNLNAVSIVSKEQVGQLLLHAQKNRSVAATMCNERSSRSHSVFRLKLTGKNEETSESCQGMLNLVDLAGSERLKESQSEGDRLKETKSINKSLSDLSNVITCLVNKNEHIPYRNSKLTHLLMNSLGGNSKTLMFVNVSPCETSLNETLNSLRFAATVNQCDIGTAQKKQAIR